MPYVIDLFSGSGGMSEGLIQAGFNIVYSSDINDDVKKTYTARHKQLGLIQGENTYFHQADIRDLSSQEIIDEIKSLKIFKGKSLPQIDAIFGGPPCQGFSRAGLRDIEDPRNTLFKEYLRIVNDIRPKYVVMENVEGFLDTYLKNYIGVLGGEYKGNTLMPELLEKEFISIGYKVIPPQILDASDFGVPQRRKRAIFLAYLEGQTPPSYPTPTTPNDVQKVTVADAISDLITDPFLKEKINYIDSRYRKESAMGRTKHISGETISKVNLISNHELSSHSELVKERFSLFKKGESSAMLKRRIGEEGINISSYPVLLNHCIKELKGKYNKSEIIELFLNGKANELLIQTLLTKKSNRYRLDPNDVSPTMVTMPDDYLSPFENRIPTVREMARIQSFDDSFIFYGKRTTGGRRRRYDVPQYTQVGNAVPPLLAKAIALEIKKAIQTPLKHLQTN